MIRSTSTERECIGDAIFSKFGAIFCNYPRGNKNNVYFVAVWRYGNLSAIEFLQLFCAMCALGKIIFGVFVFLGGISLSENGFVLGAERFVPEPHPRMAQRASNQELPPK